MSTGKPAKQGPNVLGALMDFLLLVLLVGGAGGGGYYWGTIQRMAPVKAVAPGTPGALPAESSTLPPTKLPAGKDAASTGTDPGSVSSSPPDSSKDKEKTKDKSKDREKEVPPPSTKTDDPEETSSSTSKKVGNLKYWVCSSGSEYIGYAVTVSVNGTAVDSFFGPGKSIDLTRFVKPGDNSIRFEAKLLGDQYNKHKGDDKAALTLQLVSGPQILQENFKKSDIILSYKRNASETEDHNDTKHFTKD